ncbi:MAG TPA: HAD family hydrolase [Propylenella sp.]
MRGLLFDKDGTLLDFQASWSRAYRELSLELCGGDGEAAMAMLTAGGMDPATGRCGAGSVLAAGNTIDIASCWFPGLAGAELQTMVARMDAVFYENGIRYSVAVPGARDTLATLAEAGFALGVATSDGTAATRAALAALGLAAYLPHIYGYDSVARPKPAPDIVHAFSGAIGVPPAGIAVIGDNAHDLEMARNAGAGAAIGVLTGNSSRADLAPLADAVLESICDLPAWLRASAAPA